MEENKSSDVTASLVAPSLKEEIPPIRRTSKEKLPQATQKTIQHLSWEAPLPPPNAIAEYEKIHPGFADRLLKLVENEAANRHQNNDKIINGAFVGQTLGQIFGFLAVLAVMIVGAFTTIRGYPAWGSITTLSGLAALGGAFMINRSVNSKESQKRKRKLIKG